MIDEFYLRGAKKKKKTYKTGFSIPHIGCTTFTRSSLAILEERRKGQPTHVLVGHLLWLQVTVSHSQAKSSVYLPPSLAILFKSAWLKIWACSMRGRHSVTFPPRLLRTFSNASRITLFARSPTQWMFCPNSDQTEGNWNGALYRLPTIPPKLLHEFPQCFWRTWHKTRCVGVIRVRFKQSSAPRSQGT